MREIHVVGGWYGECAPDGTYAVLVKDAHIQTSHRMLDLPPLRTNDSSVVRQNLLYLRLGPNGAIAGVGHQDDQAWLWHPVNQDWAISGTAFGPNAVIFDTAGELHVVSAPGGFTGAQGYRYVADDGLLISADESYADQGRRIWEYTDRGDVTIGQGGEGPHGDDPLIALYAGKRYVLAQGRCRAVRCQRDGDQLAIAYVHENTASAYLLWVTVAELATFPEQQTAPIVVPPPIVTPPPVEPPMDYVLPDRVREIAVLLGDRFPELRKGTDDERRAYTMKVAQQVRFELGEQWGTKRADPGRPPSKDAVARQEFIRLVSWDLINGTTREVHPAPIQGEDITGQVFIPVEPFNALGVGDPSPLLIHVYDGGDHDTGLCDLPGCWKPRTDPIHVGAVPVPVPDGSLAARLHVLEQDMITLRTQVIDAHSQAGAAVAGVFALDAEVKSLGGNITDAVRAVLAGIGIKVTIGQNGSGWLKHGHAATAIVTVGDQEISRVVSKAKATTMTKGTA